MPVIKMPDGKYRQFPDNMTEDQIGDIILSEFPDAGKGKDPSLKENAISGARTFARSATLGLSDKASKYGAMLINEIANADDQDKVRFVNNIIRENTFRQRDEDEAWAKNNPASALAANIAGGIISPISKVGSGFVGRGANLIDKAARSAAVGGVTSGIYGAAGSNADNWAGIAGDALNSAGIGAAIGGAAPIVGYGLQKGTKAGLNLIRRSTGKLKEIIKKSPLSPLLNRSEGEIEEGIAKLSNGAADRETLGAAITDGLDDELAAVNKYQKGLYDKAYSGIDKTAPMSTANTEAMLDELKDEVTPTGQKYLEKIRKNLRIEKHVKDLQQRDFGGIKPSNLSENKAFLTTQNKLQGGSLSDINELVNNKVKYNLSERLTDNIDDVTQYLKNAPAEKIKSIKQNDLAGYKKLLDEVINKEKIFNPNFKVNDPMHLIKDSARSKYLHTMHDTLNFPNVSSSGQVDGQLKEYLIKKYNNELGKDIYDTIIKKDNVLDTKFIKDKAADRVAKWLDTSTRHDATGGFNSRVFTGNKANLATPSGDLILPKLQDTVKDKINYKLSGYATDNFDDVARELKNIKPELIERLKGLSKDELKTLAQKLADDEIKKGTIKGIRDASKMVAQNRGVYVHTLPNTLSKTDVATEQAVKGQVKEYLIKKYGNEIGETIYDTVIKKDGILDTKFVNNKGHDEFVKWLKNAINRDHQSTVNEGSIVRRPTGNTVNLTTPSMQLRSVSDNTQTVKDKILDTLNANKKVMAYPNIRQLQSLKSEIGGDVMRGTNTLNSSQVGRIYDAIKKDIDKGVGSLGAGALKKADRFYRLQQKDGSITKTLEGLLGAKSDTIRASKVMNALNEKTANFKVIKALNRALNAEQIKDEGRALIRTQRDFNKLSRDGKQFLYGDKLKEAENLFNGALGDRLFKAIDGALKKSAESNLLTKNISDKTRQKIITAAIIGSLAK